MAYDWTRKSRIRLGEPLRWLQDRPHARVPGIKGFGDAMAKGEWFKPHALPEIPQVSSSIQ